MDKTEVDYLTPREVAQLLKIGYNNALDFIKHSGLPYLKIGRQYRVDRFQLNQYLKEITERNDENERNRSKN